MIILLWFFMLLNVAAAIVNARLGNPYTAAFNGFATGFIFVVIIDSIKRRLP